MHFDKLVKRPLEYMLEAQPPFPTVNFSFPIRKMGGKTPATFPR